MARSDIKYAINPGPVQGHDGQWHNLNGPELMALYGLDFNECVIVKEGRAPMGYSGEFVRGLIHLGPRSDGNYKLPEETDG